MFIFMDFDDALSSGSRLKVDDVTSLARILLTEMWQLDGFWANGEEEMVMV